MSQSKPKECLELHTKFGGEPGPGVVLAPLNDVCLHLPCVDELYHVLGSLAVGNFRFRLHTRLCSQG